MKTNFYYLTSVMSTRIFGVRLKANAPKQLDSSQSGQQFSLSTQRKFKQFKTFLAVEIIVARLISDTQVVFRIVSFRWKHLIDLAQLQRHLVPFIVQANRESHLYIFPSNAVRFVPVSSAKRTSPLS